MRILVKKTGYGRQSRLALEAMQYRLNPFQVHAEDPQDSLNVCSPHDNDSVDLLPCLNFV